MSWWSDIIGAVIGGYAAKEQADSILSKNDIMDIWRQQNPDVSNPMFDMTTDWETGQRTIEYSPEMQALFDGLLGEIAAGESYYNPDPYRQELQRRKLGYQGSRQGMWPGAPEQYRGYEPHGGLSTGLGMVPGGGGDEGSEEPPYSGGGGASDPNNPTGDPSQNTGGGGSGYGGAGGGGGGFSGGGTGIGAGAGITPGNGADFGAWWANQPAWMQRLFNSEMVQRAVGAASGVPGASFGIGQAVDYLNDRYPSGIMDPDGINFVQPGGEQQEPFQLDPSWGTGWTQGMGPQANTGRYHWAQRGANQGLGIAGSLGRGGNRFTGYNRGIYDRSAGTGSLPFDRTEPGDRYAYGPKPPWEQER